MVCLLAKEKKTLYRNITSIKCENFIILVFVRAGRRFGGIVEDAVSSRVTCTAVMETQAVVPNHKKLLYYFDNEDASRPQQYDRRAGTADMTGELFEVNVASLLFTRGLFETDSFCLATNVNHAGAFDDLLFKFKDKDRKVEHTCFLQLKTKLSSPVSSQSLCSLTGGFSLLKYYASYCDIQKQFSTRTDSAVFEGSFENCEFIIYTNTKLECEDSWQEIPTSHSPENILFSGAENGKVFNLKCDSEEDRKAFAVLESYRKHLQEISIVNYNLDELKYKLKDFQLLNQCKKLLDAYKNEELFKTLLNEQLSRIGDRPTWEQFLKKLKLYTCQAIERELEDAVQQNLETYCGTCGLQTEDIFTKLNKGMIEWWRKGKYFLTQSYVPFWDIIMENHISDLVEPMSCKLAVVAGLRFQDTEDISQKGQVTHIITDGATGTELSCLKVQQNLKDVGHIMIDNKTLQNRLREVLALWQLGLRYNVLVIEGGTDNQNVITDVSNALHSCPGKQLIIITCDYDHMASVLSETFQCTTHRDNFKLNQLDETSKKKIVECKVNFQGFSVALNAIADDTALQNALTADAVVELLMGNLKVGEELPVLDQSSYYVSRTLLRQEFVDKEVLNVKGSAYFAISGTSVQDLQLSLKPDVVITKFDNCRQVSVKECQHFVIDNVNDFNALCVLYSNVHWLHKQGDNLVLKMSKGDTESIRNDIDIKIYSNLLEITGLPDKFIVIVADPGMGKSTELSHISSEVKQFDPSTWVVRANLNNHTDYLSSDDTSAFELLLMSGKFNSIFERCLFEYNVYHGRNVVVSFDGFDEISPNYSDKVVRMLRDLEATRIEKLWITSRPIMRKKLERELNTLSFTIKAFSQENQKEFLHKFWQMMNSPHDMAIFTERLLALTQRSLSDRLFTGIPLQTRMLAEAFHAEAKHYSETGEVKLPHKLDLLQLYDKFVDRKWEIHYSEKNKVNITNVGVSEDYQELKELFQENHKNCALVTLLLHQVTKLHDPELVLKKSNNFLQKFKKGHEKIGIVVNTINNRALFSHHTFAEYFAAMWFSENFKSNKSFLEETLFKSNFQIVRKFFNRILSQNFDLHCATLNQDIDSLLVLLSEHHVDVNMRDLGGRTALHLAVMNCIDSHDDNFSSVTYQIIETLLKHGADPHVNDDVLGWRPLRIADRIGAWAAVDLLLGYTSDISDLVSTTENMNDDKFVQDILKLVAKQGFLHFLGYVFKCGVRVGHCINRGTILHEAAKHGQLKLVQFLITQHADIESQDSWNKRTPLMWAADAGQVQVVEYLIQQGSKVCTRDELGNTALLRAALYGRIEVLKLLARHNSDVKVCNNFGDNILHCATVCGDNELIIYILDKLRLNIDSYNNRHETALWRSARYGRLQVVQLLCESGADLNVQDTGWGYTPLHAAISKDHVLVAQYLIEHGAMVNTRDKFNNTGLLSAARSGHFEVLKLLSQHDKNVTTCNDEGDNILHCAVRSSNVELLRHVLSTMTVNIDCCNHRHETALWLGVRSDQFETVKLLCEYGADLNVPDAEWGWTPLHVAASRGHLQILHCLIQHGACLMACDSDGNTIF